MRLLAQAAQMQLHEQQAAHAFAQWLIQIGDGDPQIMNNDGTTNLPNGKSRL